jgi:hypothetical protein
MNAAVTNSTIQVSAKNPPSASPKLALAAAAAMYDRMKRSWAGMDDVG